MFEGLPYQTIEPPEKFPTLSPVRRFLALAVLFAGCASSEPAAPIPGGDIVELREAFTCPVPPTRGLIVITRAGAAERTVFEGFDFKLGVTKSTRETTTLSPQDAAALFDFVRGSGWEKMPENPPVVTKSSCADCCWGSMMIKTTGGQKSVHYAADNRPAKVQALIKGVEGFLSRGTWTREAYPGEKKTASP